MGCYSTLCITRTRAIQELEKAVEKLKTEHTEEGEEMLRCAMDAILQPHMKNTSIVSDDDHSNDDDRLDSILD